MFRNGLTLLFCVAAVVAAVSPAGAQQADAAALGQRIERLTVSLEQIAVALERIQSDQRVQLLIRRIELEERRLNPLSGELSSARHQARQHQDDIAQMESIRATRGRRIDQAERDGADPQSLLGDREEIRNLTAMIELETERQLETERRVIELENRLAGRRKRIEILDEQLEELLQ